VRSRGGRRGSRPILAGLAAGVIVLGGSARPILAQETLPDTLDLERALRIAVNRSPILRRVQAAADATGADRRAAIGAFLLTASTSMSLSRSTFTRTTFVGEEGESQTLPQPLSSTSQSANQSINLSWMVLDGGRRFATLREQSANVRAAQRQLGQFENLFKNLGDVTNGFPKEADLASIANRAEYDPRMLHENLMFGTPDEVIAKLKPYENLGIDAFIYYASLGLGMAEQKRSLELFIDEVVPAFT